MEDSVQVLGKGSRRVMHRPPNPGSGILGLMVNYDRVIFVHATLWVPLPNNSIPEDSA